MRFNASSILRISLRSRSRVRSSRLNSSSCVARSFGIGEVGRLILHVQHGAVDLHHEIALPVLQDAREVLELLLAHVLLAAVGDVRLDVARSRQQARRSGLTRRRRRRRSAACASACTNGRESNLTVGAAFSRGYARAVGRGGCGRRGRRRLRFGTCAGCSAASRFACRVCVSCLTAAVSGSVCAVSLLPSIVWLGLDAVALPFWQPAALRAAAFFGIAFPGFFAALLAFFEGIRCLRLQRESARLYRRSNGVYRAARLPLFDR